MPAAWKTVRVFISSTFRDMQAERNHLVRFVFPRLREQLLPRRIHLVDMDLRWGVTSEQDASEVCREIINECRPRFLCMLGGRYGTIPEGRELSITADEVHFGVLDAHGERMYGLFYFRHGAVTEKMDPSSPGFVREPRHSEKAAKLARLKRGIRRAKCKPFLYRPRWNADEQRLLDLKAFGDRVARDVLATIDDEFGTHPPAQLDEFAAENAAMEAFVEERSERFVLGSRETVLGELLAHALATGDNGYVCLTGAPGSGKSALLAHLSQHSTLNNQPSMLLVRHFVGASPGSTDVRRTLRRLCHELKAGCPDITAEIPDDPEELRAAFPDFLRQACARQRVVILLDAVNQFDPASHSAELHWLPEELPEGARLILSAVDGPALEELRRHPGKPREIELEPLTAADGEAIIEQFRTRYRKQFEPDQRAALLPKTDAGTPLYLLAALEELRTLGTYDEISERIAELPPTTHELFRWILKRLENDDGFRDASGRRVGHDLVSRFAALLGASRHGLSQHELADLLAPGDAKTDPPIEPDPQGNVAALLHLLRPYLMRRGELLDFCHSQLREAVECEYLGNEQERLVVHCSLAGYFHRVADSREKGEWGGSLRGLTEVSHHLIAAQSWGMATDLLTDTAYLQARIDGDRSPIPVHEDIQQLARRIPTESCEAGLVRRFAAAFQRQQHNLVSWPRSTMAQLYPEVSASAQTGTHDFAPWIRRESARMRRHRIPWLRRLNVPIRPPSERITLVADREGPARGGHTAQIYAMAAWKHGQLAMTGGEDTRVILWDLSALRAKTCMVGHTAPVLDCAVSADEALAATCDASGRMILWLLADNPAILENVQDAHWDAPEIMCVAVSPDHQKVAYGRGDGTVVVTAPGQGEPDKRFQYEAPYAHGRVVRRHGKEDNDNDSGLPGLYFPPTYMAFFPSAQELFIFSRFLRTCERRDIATFQVQIQYGLAENITCAALSANGQVICAGTDTGKLMIFDSRSPEPVWTVDAHTDAVLCCSLDVSGVTAVSCSRDDSVRLWDLKARQEKTPLRTTASLVTQVKVLNRSSRLLVGTMDGHVTLHRLTDEVSSRPASSCYRVSALSLNLAETAAVSVADDGSVVRWDVGDALRQVTCENWDMDILSCAMAPSGLSSAFGCANGEVFVWDHASGARYLLATLERSARLCRYQDERTLLIGDDGGNVTMWNTGDRRRLTRIRAHESLLLNCGLASSGRTIVTSGEDGKLRIWDMGVGAAWWEIGGRIPWISPDGVLFAVKRKGAIKVKNCVTLDVIARLEGEFGKLMECRFTSSCDRLLALCEDRVSIWSLAGQTPVSAYAPDALLTCVDVGESRVLLGTRDGGIVSLAQENLAAIESQGARWTRAHAAIEKAMASVSGRRVWRIARLSAVRVMLDQQDAEQMARALSDHWAESVAGVIRSDTSAGADEWLTLPLREKCLAARLTPCSFLEILGVMEP